YWEPGRHLAIDESIIPFTGRAREIVEIPNKPDPIGFKAWQLCDNAYPLDWLFHARGTNYNAGEGPQDLDPRWRLEEGWSPTHGLVLELLHRQVDGQRLYPPNKHYVWFDNLFITVRLLEQLREWGIAAAGTVR
ncbi:hypothetical protein K469DRAFT_529021, partial [Zopfia rhizophila CBS 207.26]